MAINAAMELGRTVGLEPAKDAAGKVLPILSGQYVRFANYDLGEGADAVAGLFPAVIAAKASDEIAETGDVIGIAADDTEYKGWNGFYETIDGFYKYKKIAAYVLGGQFHIWNDGRGPVFDPAVAGAKAGTPLYIGSFKKDGVTFEGVLTTTAPDAAAAGTIGAEAVGIVLRAPVTEDQVAAEAAIDPVKAKNVRAHSVLFFKAVK